MTVYVGDLPKSATQDFLRQAFGNAGTVKDCTLRTVKRDGAEDVRYAFVTYEQASSAQQAVSQLNYSKMDKVTIRVSLADPDTRRILKSKKGNLFVKNLDPTIEVGQLHDALANFGEIVSCKIPKNPKTGEGCGYGYVQFRDPNDAERAKEDLKEASINGRSIIVENYCKRARSNPEETFTNVYVKNLPVSIQTDDDLTGLFGPYIVLTEDGKPNVSSKVVRLDDGRCFGFCDVRVHDNAKAAVEALNHTTLEGSVLEACRQMARDERMKVIAERTRKWREEQRRKYAGRNLYVRNFDEAVDESQLKELFGKFGGVESVKVARDESGTSRRFGWVCYEEKASARQCLASPHEMELNSHTLYVAHMLMKTELQQRAMDTNRVRSTSGRRGEASAMTAPGSSRDELLKLLRESVTFQADRSEKEHAIKALSDDQIDGLMHTEQSWKSFIAQEPSSQ